MNRRASSDSLDAALTRPMIAARRAASTKRRLSELSAVAPAGWGGSPTLSAEGDCDDGMVSVPLGTAEPCHLTMRVEADDRRYRVPQGGGDRLDFLRNALSQRTSPPRAVEDQRGLGFRAAEGVDRGVHRGGAALEQLVVVELGELDH